MSNHPSNHPLKSIGALVANATAVDHLFPTLEAVARRDGAEVVGVHLLMRPGNDLYQMVGEVWVVEQNEMVEERAAETEEALRSRCETAGIAMRWLAVEDDLDQPTLATSRACRAFQLVVAGQRTGNELYSHQPENLVMELGRPVLVVPSSAKFGQVGERVLIAWNGSREAARAAFDAVPLLADGAKIRIITVRDSSVEPGGAFAPGDDLAQSLALLGFDVEVTRARTTNLSAGDEILNEITNWGADLLVLGAYGHSRLRETIFGGVTRTVFDHMTAPVLASH